MLKRFTFIIYLLLAIMPLQSIASANMLVCNRMLSQQSQGSNCHQQQLQQSDLTHHSEHSSSTKVQCAILCASMCAFSMFATLTNLNLLPEADTAYTPLQVIYTSITLPNLQRPPIAFS